MRTLNDILNTRISFQENTWADPQSETILIGEILIEIKSPKYAKQIQQLRGYLENEKKDFYDTYKKRLPAVTFSGIFKDRRTVDNCEIYNHIIVLDIDKLDTPQMEEAYEKLRQEETVCAFWRSPSNKGYKGLIPIRYELDDFSTYSIDLIHKSAFNKVCKIFYEKHLLELDKSGSDVTRLCFVSYDENLYLKTSIKEVVIINDDIVNLKTKTYSAQTIKFSSNRDALYNPLDRNSARDRKTMSDIMRYLIRKQLSITSTYPTWCRVAMAISNSFTFEIGLKYFLKLSSLDKDKFDERICTNFLTNCYETRKGNVNFNTIVFLANQAGFKTKYQKNGVPKVEV